MPIPTESRSNSKQQVSVGATSISAPKMGGLLLLILIVTIVAFLPTSLSLNEKWYMSGQGYSHGYLLLAICIYVIYEKRLKYRLATRKPCWLFIAPLLGFCAIWLLLNLAGIQTLQQLMLPIIYITICGLIFGFRFALSISPAVGFIFFGIPI